MQHPSKHDYSTLIEQPAFQHLSALWHVGYTLHWRKAHPKTPFWALTNLAIQVVTDLPTISKQAVFNALLDLFFTLTIDDTSLHYSTDDMDWLIETIERDDARTCLLLFAGHASCSRTRSQEQEREEEHGDENLPNL